MSIKAYKIKKNLNSYQMKQNDDNVTICLKNYHYLSLHLNFIFVLNIQNRFFKKYSTNITSFIYKTKKKRIKNKVKKKRKRRILLFDHYNIFYFIIKYSL